MKKYLYLLCLILFLISGISLYSQNLFNSWTGNTSSNWYDETNWSLGIVPGTSHNVLISPAAFMPVILGGNAVCDNLILNENTSLSVYGKLTVNGDLILKSNKDYTSSLYLTETDDITVNGNITIEKFAPGKAYTFLTSPFKNISFNEIKGLTVMNFNGQYYNPDLAVTAQNFSTVWMYEQHHTHNSIADQNGWRAPMGASAMLEPARGYAVYFENDTVISFTSTQENFFSTNDTAITYTLPRSQFSTDFAHNNTYIDIYGKMSDQENGMFSSTGPANGSHLIGNPFAGPIEWDKVESDFQSFTGDVSRYVAFHKNTTAFTGIFGYYSPYAGSIGSFTHNGYIQPQEAFYIRNIDMDNDFDNAFITLKTSHVSADKQALNLKEEEVPLKRLDVPYAKFSVSSENIPIFKDEIGFVFNVDDIDNNLIDIRKVNNSDLNYPNVYTQLDNQSYVVKSFDNISPILRIPVHLSVGKTGSYVFRIDNLEMISDSIRILLQDLQAGTIHDFKSEPAYVFQASATDDNNRFLLLFQNPAGTTNTNEHLPQQAIHIYSSENFLHIVNLNPPLYNSSLDIYDMTGKIIMQNVKLPSGSSSIRMSFNPGIYNVRVSTPQNGTHLVTKVINN